MQYAGLGCWYQENMEGYYTEMLNGTNRKSNYCTREKVKEQYIRYP